MCIPLFIMALPVALVCWWIASKDRGPWKPELILMVWSVLWSIGVSPLPDYFIGRLGPTCRFDVDDVLLYTMGVTLLTPVLIGLRLWRRRACTTTNRSLRAALLAIWCVVVLGAYEFSGTTDWFLRGFVVWVDTHVDVAAISARQAEAVGKVPVGEVKERRSYKPMPPCDTVRLYDGRVLVMSWGSHGPSCGLWFDPTESIELPRYDRAVHIAPGVWAWSDSG